MGRQRISLRPEADHAARTLGAMVRQHRLRARMTIAEIASRANVSARTVSEVEDGNPSVSIGNALNIASVLGVPLFGTSDRDTLALISAKASADVAAVGRTRSRKSSVISDAVADF